MRPTCSMICLWLTLLSSPLAVGQTPEENREQRRFSMEMSEDGRSIWRLDQDTGEVSFCTVESGEVAPSCSDWTALKVERESVSSSESEGQSNGFACSFEVPKGSLESYYQRVDGLDGASLRSALQELLPQNTRKLTYNAVWGALETTDEDPCNPGNVVLLYVGRSQPASSRAGSGKGQSDKWTREHVWPKSHGFRAKRMPAYTDIHHLRPADKSVNSSRGHLDFAVGGERHHEAPDTFRSSETWEPRDAVKGDIARMLFYMELRYANDPQVPTLTLLDSPTDSDQPNLGFLCTLIGWHAADPVDDWERRRNSLIESIQGNRNPFIDHPQWVSSVWHNRCQS